MNFPLSVALAASDKLWYIVSSFLIISSKSTLEFVF